MSADREREAAPTIRHHAFQGPSGSVHYVEAGAGKPVLLIHGGHGGWVHWIANIEALAHRHRILALDLPGFGRSADPGGRSTVADYAAVVTSLIATLHLRKVALVGFSFGTFVAATAAIEDPIAITSLTLVNPPGVGERTAAGIALPDRLSAVAKEQGLRAGVIASLKEMMLHNHDLINEELVSLIADSVSQTRYSTRRLSRQLEMIPILEKIRQKTLVVFGEKDPYHSHDLQGRSSRINRALDTPATMVIGGAAHWVQYDQPERFNQVLLEFIGDEDPCSA